MEFNEGSPPGRAATWVGYPLRPACTGSAGFLHVQTACAAERDASASQESHAGRLSCAALESGDTAPFGLSDPGPEPFCTVPPQHGSCPPASRASPAPSGRHLAPAAMRQLPEPIASLTESPAC